MVFRSEARQQQTFHGQNVPSFEGESWSYNTTKLLDQPPLTVEDLGAVRQDGSEKYFTWPHEIYPPTCFLGFQNRWGGTPDARL